MKRQIGDAFYSSKQISSGLHRPKKRLAVVASTQVVIAEPESLKLSEPMPPLQEGNSRHHLFTRAMIRKELVKIFGEPKTEGEHLWMQREVKRVHRLMPQYKIGDELHKRIHREPSR